MSRLKQCTSGSGFRACHWKTRGGWSRRERRSFSTEGKAQQQHRQVEVLQLWSHKPRGRLLGSLRERFLRPICLDYRWNTNNYVVHSSPLLYHSLNQVSPWFPMHIHSYNLIITLHMYSLILRLFSAWMEWNTITPMAMAFNPSAELCSVPIS